MNKSLQGFVAGQAALASSLRAERLVIIAAAQVCLTATAIDLQNQYMQAIRVVPCFGHLRCHQFDAKNCLSVKLLNQILFRFLELVA